MYFETSIPKFNPFESTFSDFEKVLLNSERSLGASLTINCNLGGEVSNLICHKLKIDGQASVIKSQIKAIYEQLQEILSDKISPTIFLDDKGNNFTVSSLNLANLKVGKVFNTFDEAIVAYLNSLKTPVKQIVDKDKIREERQRKAVEGYNSKAKEMREYGNFIFSSALQLLNTFFGHFEHLYSGKHFYNENVWDAFYIMRKEN